MTEPALIRIGNQTACSAETPLQPFEFAVANGFEVFEWFPDKKPSGEGWDEDDLTAEKRREIRVVARARGMDLSVHARGQANPLTPDAHQVLLQDIELANDLGAKLLNIHLHTEAGLEAYVKSIVPLVARLAELDIQLAIENTPPTTPDDFNELFTRLHGRPSCRTAGVGMCLDLGHANLCPATHNDYLRYLDQLGPHVPIIHVHLHENWGDYDSHLPLFTGPAGSNPAGVKGFVARLKRRHYSGAFILEQWPRPPSLLNEARERLLGMWREPIGEPKRSEPSPRAAEAGFGRAPGAAAKGADPDDHQFGAEQCRARGSSRNLDWSFI
jgi:sugar phosphate isomerase/epimerase